MLKEMLHFARHAPGTLLLKSKLPHAELYDALMLRAEEAGLAAKRAALTMGLRGRVLEIGCGTGLMFRYYDPKARVSAIELAPDFLEQAQKRVATAGARISLFSADAQTLPFAENAFDAAVIAMVLCSVPSVQAVLSELRRVLKPGGELRLLEHVRSERPLSGKVMDWLNPVWLALNQQGCNMNRDTVSTLKANGFVLQSVESFKTFAPGLPTFPKRLIRAVPA